MTEWQNVCVLCAKRDRVTRVESGHCCIPCASGLQTQIADIGRLCEDAAAYLLPSSTGGGGSSTSFGSRPPLNVAAIDPEMADIPRFDGDEHPVALLVIMEEWCRLIREFRGLSPYGAASAIVPAPKREAMAQPRPMWTVDPQPVVLDGALRGDVRHGHTRPSSLVSSTEATLLGAVTFLGRQMAWIIDAGDFPLEDFADEMYRCLSAVRRWDSERRAKGYVVLCPTMTDREDADGNAVLCGKRITFHEDDTWITCRTCGVTRDVQQLIRVATSDPDAELWVDPEAAAAHFNLSERTLRRWASKGIIRRDHGRYRSSDIAKAKLENAS